MYDRDDKLKHRETGDCVQKERFSYLLLNREHYLNLIEAGTPKAKEMQAYLAERRERTDPPTLEAISQDIGKYFALSFSPTADFLRQYIAKYQEKVLVVKNKADRKRLFKLLVKRYV